MDQLSLAIQQTAANAEGGVKRLAQLMGTNHQTLINRCNPHCDSHKLGVHEAFAMMLLTGDVQILEVMAAELGYDVERKEKKRERDLISAILSADAEHGDVVRTIQEALADNHISPRELAQIRTAVNGAKQALDTLYGTVTDLHKDQAPR